MAEKHPEFLAALTEGVKLVAKEIGYFPNRFAALVREQGAVDAVTLLIMEDRPSDIFRDLHLAKHLELSVEDHALRCAWAKLFHPNVLQSARDRLTQYGYVFPENRWPHCKE